MSGIKYIGIIGWNEHTKILANNFHFQTKGTEILAIAAHEPEAQKYAREVLGLKHVYTEPHPLYELHQLNAVCIQSSGEYHLDHGEQGDIYGCYPSRYRYGKMAH